MKNFEIRTIDLTSLSELEELLSVSLGYPTSMADEISYFEEESPKGWFYAVDKNEKKLGFIRCFKQGDDWSLGELFVEAGSQDRKLIAEELVKTFLTSNSFSSKHRLRFDVGCDDNDVNDIFKQSAFNIKSQTFHHFELTIPRCLGVKNVEEAHRMAPADEVAKTMSNLHAVSANEAQEWIESGSLRIEMASGQVAAVAKVDIYPQSAKIDRLATHEKFLRQGHARKLMAKISMELSACNIPTLFLKVEDVRGPAIAFYRNFGFEEILEKKQTWHSIHF
ncbi:N-acetyltransferase [Bdellovibrio sp. KM01]|uniref:GNAT family N-acetyltransferase n=1 Tax=Bdellovibrio sp. KM01 TaxID=2748865 RepID=UPI0015EA8D53|nr:GNAT family N-acetyltransferase [Bdellovibrio sp. KM01]QLY25273.1 GNAT family N-acetyltransferase [Bdellovibrio sp. KM01]